MRLGSAERREQLGAGLARRVGPLTASKTAELPKGDRGKGGFLTAWASTSPRACGQWSARVRAGPLTRLSLGPTMSERRPVGRKRCSKSLLLGTPTCSRTSGKGQWHKYAWWLRRFRMECPILVGGSWRGGQSATALTNESQRRPSLLLVDALNLIRRVYAAQPGEDGPERAEGAKASSVQSLRRRGRVFQISPVGDTNLTHSSR